jgi:hypothetical protein
MTKNLEPFIPPGTLLCPMTLRALNVRLYKIWGGAYRDPRDIQSHGT